MQWEATLFRHVVMFKLVATTTAEQKTAALMALSRLPDQISQIRSFSVGDDARMAEGNFDVVVIVDFDSCDDYLIYSAHPAHREVVSTFVVPVLAARAAVQYAVVH